MIKFHLKRNTTVFKMAIMTVVLLIPVLISYLSTFKWYKYWCSVLIQQPSDVNLVNVQQSVDNYSGLTYYFNFLFSGDILLIFTIIFMMFVTFLVGNNVIEDIKSAYGNIIVTRVDYGKYFVSNILASTIFSFIYLLCFFTILFVISYIFGGDVDFTTDLNVAYGFDKISDNIFSFYLTAMFQVFQIFITSSLIVVSGTTLSVVIRNKYVLQMFPIVYFIVSGIIGEFLLNFSEMLGIKFMTLAIQKRLSFFEMNYFQVDEISSIFQIDYTSPINFILIMGISILIFGAINVAKYRKNYL